MKHMHLRNVLIAAVFCLLPFGSSKVSAQGDPAAVFATVNGESIKASDFWHRLAWYRIDTSSPLAQLPAGFQAINQLITEHLLFQLARDKGCVPTELEVQAEIKRRETQDPTLLQGLKAEGRPESDLYDEVKFGLAQYKLRTFGITITDQEVEQHYKDYPGEFTRPQQYKLKVIVVNSETEAAAVDKEISSGKSFADAASAHSLDISKVSGGDFGPVAANQLGAPAAEALRGLKIGQATDWVVGTGDSPLRVKYLLVDIIPTSVRPLDPALRNEIRRKLSLDKGMIKNPVVEELQQATLSAKVTINQPGYQKIFDQMVLTYAKNH